MNKITIHCARATCQVGAEHRDKLVKIVYDADRLYGNFYTEEDLKGLIAFYKPGKIS
jgi:hypothetical protein